MTDALGGRAGVGVCRRLRPRRKGRVTLLGFAVFAGTAALGVTLGGGVARPASVSGRYARGLDRGVTSYDRAGTFLLDGRRAFLIALANPPPLGATTPSGGNGLDEVVGAGVNLFRVGPNWGPWTPGWIVRVKEWDEAAAARGVHTWINLTTLAGAHPRWRIAQRLTEVVRALLAGPGKIGIGLWKGADEPFLQGLAPRSLAFAYCRVTGRGDRRWCAGQHPLDRDHLWVTIEAPRGTAADLAPYSLHTDTHGVDVYPVIDYGNDPRAAVAAAAVGPDLHLVGLWTRRVASITPDHSVWTTLQICFSRGYDPTTGRYLLPARDQERYMIYDAIINGARGLGFFGGDNSHCWNETDRANGWNWTFWNRTLRALIAEINARSPLAPALVNPASTRRLITSDPETEAISRTDTTPGGNEQLWVIAARSGPGGRPVTISGLPATAGDATVYTEGRTLAADHGSFTDLFRQWQVHVYEFDLPKRTP